MELRVNGVTYATDATSPYAFSWNSTTASDGARTLVAYAFDAGGNSRASGPIAVTVANAPAVSVVDTVPPVVSISNPRAGSHVGGMVWITVNSSDNFGPDRITNTLYVDGAVVATGNGGVLSFKWNARKASAGTHTIKAIARDAAGNTSMTTIQVYR